MPKEMTYLNDRMIFCPFCKEPKVYVLEDMTEHYAKDGETITQIDHDFGFYCSKCNRLIEGVITKDRV